MRGTELLLLHFDLAEAFDNELIEMGNCHVLGVIFDQKFKFNAHLKDVYQLFLRRGYVPSSMLTTVLD